MRIDEGLASGFFEPAGCAPNEQTSRSLAYQSWTAENLCVESYHEVIKYYTSRWDALCPYIDVTPEMLASARKPFLVYALPPDGNLGVPINDNYGLANVAAESFWTDPWRARKFRELDKLFRDFEISERVVAGKDLTVEYILKIGSEHFDAYEIHAMEVDGFVDYIRKLDVLILQVHAANGDLVLTDISMLLPARDQVYGSFCQWNIDYKKRSPGIFACVLAARWAARNGYKYYNLGPVGDYGYKSLLVTDLEPIYGIAMTDPDHPLALDPSSPLHTDFNPAQWNQMHRNSAD